jgi:hypothetical protein
LSGVFEGGNKFQRVTATACRWIHPVGPAKLKLSLFVSEEVFYDWSFNSWVRKSCGDWSYQSSKQTSTLDLYYMRQNDSHSFSRRLGTSLELHGGLSCEEPPVRSSTICIICVFGYCFADSLISCGQRLSSKTVTTGAAHSIDICERNFPRMSFDL